MFEPLPLPCTQFAFKPMNLEVLYHVKVGEQCKAAIFGMRTELAVNRYFYRHRNQPIQQKTWHT
jgi:hypothetical protein